MTGARPPGEWKTLADLPSAARSALDARWHPDLAAGALDLDAFAADVILLWQRGRGRLGLPCTTEAWRAHMDGLHVEDLVLARRCERGDEAAWARLHVRHVADLEQVLRRSAGAEEARAHATAVIADLALPPATGPDRTRVGAYEGSGPLWAWLATIGIRRLHRARATRPLSLDRTPVDPQEATTRDPERAGNEEHLARFRAALGAAWQALQPREALALVWKHHHGHPQRRIARLLGVSEPTVSRLVQAGLEKVRGHLRSTLPEGLVPDRAAWDGLVEALASHLERTAAGLHLEENAS